MIRLVISDMDGTIIGRNEQVPAEAAEFISNLEAHGILFTIATGRSEGYMQSKIKQMGIRHPYIATNGATIMNGSCAVMRKQFSIAPLRQVLEHCRELGLSVMYTFMGEERTEFLSDWVLREGEKRGRPYTAEPFTEEEWACLKADKILIMDPARSGAVFEVEQLLNAVGSDAVYVRYRDKALELNEKTANKAAAIEKLIQILQVPMQEVLVIGDDDNDIEMFSAGCKSAAVGNVSENARPFADYVCRAALFDGVKEAVAHFCRI